MVISTTVRRRPSVRSTASVGHLSSQWSVYRLPHLESCLSDESNLTVPLWRTKLFIFLTRALQPFRTSKLVDGQHANTRRHQHTSHRVTVSRIYDRLYRPHRPHRHAWSLGRDHRSVTSEAPPRHFLREGQYNVFLYPESCLHDDNKRL